MEAQFTIRDTLEGFRGWLNTYQTARMKSRAWRGASTWESEDTYSMNYFTPWQDAHIVFRVRVVGAELLEAHVAVIWTREARDEDRRRTEEAELDAYFGELVRAIRAKWETVSLTVTELYEQSYRKLKNGEKPKDVFSGFFLPNLPEAEKPQDASQAADVHNAWKAAMTYRRKSRRG